MHTGIFLEARPKKPEAPKASQQLQSDSDRTITVIVEGTDESIALGAKTSTTVAELKDLLGHLAQVSPDQIILKRKLTTGTVVQKQFEEAASTVYISGIHSFKRPVKQYDHPVLVVGAGLGGIQMMMEMQDRGRKDFICMEKHADFGGHSWIAVPNKFTKLQTERGTYHVDYIRPWAKVPTEVHGLQYKTWPSRDALLRMMQLGARDNGLEPYVMFKTEIQKVSPKKGTYVIQHLPSDEEDGDGGVTMVSAVSSWPGFLHLPNMVEFPGEEEFGGYIEYSSFDKVDYSMCIDRVCSLYGHGAFTIENVRTLCEHRCKKVNVVCRTRNLSGTKMASWLVGSLPTPLPATVLLDAFKKMYDLVGFDVWLAHSVQTDEKRTYAQISQKTIFGVTDIYFLAGYYGLMQVIVDEVKRLSHHTIHTKKSKKIECEVFIKAIGTTPSFKIGKQLGIKELVGFWAQGDPLRYVCISSKGVQARNFASFSIGPGMAPGVKVANWFLDYPQDWALIEDKLPRNKDGQWPAYVTGATYGLPCGMAISSSIPLLAQQMGEADAIKARKQNESHPLEVYLNQCTREWEAYIKYFRDHNMVDDRPDPPYPYSYEGMLDLIDKAARVQRGERVDFF